MATETHHTMGKTAEHTARNAQHTARVMTDYVGRVGEINAEIAQRTAEVWVEGLRKQTQLSKRVTQEFAEKTIEQVHGGEGSFAPGFPDRWAPYHYDPPWGLRRTWARALRETYEAANDARQTAVLSAQRTARDAQSRAAEQTAKVVETTAPRNGGFPIADYEAKTVGEITDRLDALSDEQLRRVKDHEKSTKNRETLLQQIDRRIMRTS